MPTVLGINFGHDGAIALVKENRLEVAISNERLSRVKKASGVTNQMLEYVLTASSTKLSEINMVAFSSYLYHPKNELKIFTPGGDEVKRHLIDLNGGQTFAEYRIRIGTQILPAILVHHHLAHCASGFYTSSFEKSACFSVDASGERPEACSVYAYGEGEKLHYLNCPGVMIGNAYSVITEKLGLGPGLTKAGTTMGLAPYGKPSALAKKRARYFYQSFYERNFQPSDGVFIGNMWGELSGLAPHEAIPQEESDSKQSMNLAASLQYIFEEALLKASDELFDKTKKFNDKNLILSGGSFLNSDANMRLKKDGKFDAIHLFPACGDDGTAAGAALYVVHHLMSQPREEYKPREIMYLGKEYQVQAGGNEYVQSEVADALSEGKIVAWFQGKSEFGPRALGNRSILADPRNKEMTDTLNKEIKKREWFRPFAPVVLEEEKNEWFDIDFESKYMLFIAGTKKGKEIPAVTHVDNTARLQTVSREDNQAYYDLIRCFGEKTGVPVLLNTSLNVNNEPLVESPEDAIRFFNSTDVELLVIGEKVFRKGEF